ncbi:MAG: hypothetical protein HQL31_05915, partial [Planctomycetes bacterium]|nr:hypothetical protein [Planctomycetota bacterium]
RFGLDEGDADANVRAVIEAQMLAMKLHTRHLPPAKTLHVSGGASQNDSILKIMADVFGSRVKRLRTSAGASLGAALMAFQAESEKPWHEVHKGFVEFEARVFEPDLVANSNYRELLTVYSTCEDFILRQGPDPESARIAFIKRIK